MENNNFYSPQHPMKWHKFLVYFGLWAGALLSFVNGIRLLTGSVYGSEYNRDRVYSVYSAMKSVDVIAGFLMILVGIFYVYTTIQLIQFRAKGPKLLFALYFIAAGVSILYLILASSTTGLSLADLGGTSYLSSIVGAVIGAAICKVYYDKRAAMFVN